MTLTVSEASDSIRLMIQAIYHLILNRPIIQPRIVLSLVQTYIGKLLQLEIHAGCSETTGPGSFHDKSTSLCTYIHTYTHFSHLFFKHGYWGYQVSRF